MRSSRFQVALKGIAATGRDTISSVSASITLKVRECWFGQTPGGINQ